MSVDKYLKEALPIIQALGKTHGLNVWAIDTDRRNYTVGKTVVSYLHMSIYYGDKPSEEDAIIQYEFEHPDVEIKRAN